MSGQFQLLGEADGVPVSTVNGGGAGAFLIVCEHASNKLPARLGTLGLSSDALNAHIAWDPGALAVSLRLAELLDSPLIHQNFSRLAYDCNRPPEAGDAMPAISEIFEIPGNRSIEPDERQARIDEIYAPFRQAISSFIAGRKAGGHWPVMVTIHSFTPVYKGVRRDVEIGILHDRDAEFADGMLALSQARNEYVVRRNEPYGPADGVTHTLKEHGIANGLRNVMIEIRNDLIKEKTGQEVMARYLAELIREAATVSAYNTKTSRNAG
jgi:predicted N-formylglutamate amidohydrolase